MRPKTQMVSPQVTPTRPSSKPNSTEPLINPVQMPTYAVAGCNKVNGPFEGSLEVAVLGADPGACGDAGGPAVMCTLQICTGCESP